MLYTFSHVHDHANWVTGLERRALSRNPLSRSTPCNRPWNDWFKISWTVNSQAVAYTKRLQHKMGDILNYDFTEIMAGCLKKMGYSSLDMHVWNEISFYWSTNISLGCCTDALVITFQQQVLKGHYLGFYGCGSKTFNELKHVNFTII